MNPLDPHARLVCRVIRLGRAFTERFGSQHIAGCTACQEFFRQGEALDRSLREEARQIAAAPPGGLEQRIAQALRAAAPQPARHRAFPVVGVALSAAAALVLLGLWILRPIPSPTDDGHQRIASDVVTPPGFATPQLIDRLWTALPESADTLLDRNPLRKEADAVYADARSAVQFLALNFLPATTGGPPSQAGSSHRASAGG
jgi:hypothetical protein